MATYLPGAVGSSRRTHFVAQTSPILHELTFREAYENPQHLSRMDALHPVALLSQAERTLNEYAISDPTIQESSRKQNVETFSPVTVERQWSTALVHL
jgi:hypothetical protein